MLKKDLPLGQNYLITIVGPTAIGKTALSIKLAAYFNTDILSADSRQFFKEMRIGTAVPSLQEQAAATHHFIQHKSIQEAYNVGSFEKDAISKLTELFKTKQVVIMVGGSGLYIDAVTKGLDYFPEVDQHIRQNLNKRLEIEGLSALQKQLQLLDPLAYNSIAISNPHRVIRALEICIGSGQAYSSFLNRTKTKRPFKIISIGLTATREILYTRINKRVDKMLDHGLLNEVKTLTDYQHLNALNTVGYKELFRYLNRDISLDFAISEIKKNTRRFAKRQITWFKKNDKTLWLDYLADPLEVIKKIKEQQR